MQNTGRCSAAISVNPDRFSCPILFVCLLLLGRQRGFEEEAEGFHRRQAGEHQGQQGEHSRSHGAC